MLNFIKSHLHSNKGIGYVPIVREITFIGETSIVNNAYVVQQSTSEGIKIYCISATTKDCEKMRYQLRKLKSTDVYLYLQSRLLMEPFIENDLEKVLEICKFKLPEVTIREYSVFML